MAQLDSTQISVSPQGATTPTIEQFLRGEAAGWAGTASPSPRKDHGKEDVAPQNKISVLARARQKAKQWRRNLSKKKQNGHEDNTTPSSWSCGSLDNNEDDEQDPEYLGAPMYESELAPEAYKETARQHPRATPVISEKHVLVSSVRGDAEQSPTKTITETVTEKLAPAYATVAEATHTITSKIQNLTVGTKAAEPATGQHHASASEQMRDRGVSVKEYLMHKLEPGEDEKALSQVISEAMSPRANPGDLGVVERVREAVTSLIRAEESAPLTITTSNSSSQIPISTNAHDVICEESQGRILQAN